MSANTWKSWGLGLALALSPAVTTAIVTAAEAAREDVETAAHTGTFVSAEGQEFTMKDDTGSAHKHTLATDAKVTGPDGQPCQIADLKAGQKIRVTTQEGNVKVATKVECVV